MRTSCDIDVLVHREDLEKVISYLIHNKHYVEKERATHDVSLFTQTGIHVEIHFDLIEEGRAENAIDVLQSVWENVALHENSEYWYEMTEFYQTAIEHVYFFVKLNLRKLLYVIVFYRKEENEA